VACQFIAREDYGSLRLCIDYRGLNEVTRNGAYPIPRVDDTLDELNSSNVYTHLDLTHGFGQVREREDDVPITASRTLYDLLMERIAMPFGLCNAPTTFQRMMNDIMCECLHKFVAVCLDDVRVYSCTMEEHFEHLLLVIQRFKED
jgi:hypothetical protein